MYTASCRVLPFYNCLRAQILFFFLSFFVSPSRAQTAAYTAQDTRNQDRNGLAAPIRQAVSKNGP